MWAYAGNPFGEQPPTSSGYTLNLRFAGQYYDAESGLVHNDQRDYCPACGRYVQSDPIGLAGGISTYAADLNSPLSYNDPSGLCTDGDKQHCEQLLQIDTDTCNAITKRRGAAAGAACHASATERYAACYRDRPLPPLNTWNNRESFEPFSLQYWQEATGLSGAALAAYLIVSEGSRLIPVRNLVPVP
jgi:RHS repeat-associated protein